MTKMKLGTPEKKVWSVKCEDKENQKVENDKK